MKIQAHIHNLINKIINIVFWLCMIGVLWFVVQIFVFASFKIPSDSMEPGLTTGDNILVLKPTIGPAYLIYLLLCVTNNQRFTESPV